MDIKEKAKERDWKKEWEDFRRYYIEPFEKDICEGNRTTITECYSTIKGKVDRFIATISTHIGMRHRFLIAEKVQEIIPCQYIEEEKLNKHIERLWPKTPSGALAIPQCYIDLVWQRIAEDRIGMSKAEIADLVKSMTNFTVEQATKVVDEMYAEMSECEAAEESETSKELVDLCKAPKKITSTPAIFERKKLRGMPDPYIHDEESEWL